MTQTSQQKQLLSKSAILFLTFLLYSMIGWAYEVFLEVVVYQWGFSNRGVLFGPYCPIYGVGAFLFLLCFYRFRKGSSVLSTIIRFVLIYFGCVLVATVIELGASYLLEWTSGSWPWQTYVNYQYNFQGRIALSTSLRFGIGGICFLYLIQPAIDVCAKKIPKKYLLCTAAITGCLFLLDVLTTLLRL